jgi:hypothetical protein
MEKTIKERIQTLVAERNTIEIQHNAECKANQKANQDFQQKATENQTRYAQLTGGIAELQKLIAEQPKKGTNNDNSIPTPDLGDRVTDVCLSEQPQGR